MHDGRTHKTEHISFKLVGNTLCLVFWTEESKKADTKECIAISKIDCLSSSAEESIQKNNKEIAEVLYGISGNLTGINADTKAILADFMKLNIALRGPQDETLTLTEEEKEKLKSLA